MAKQQQKRRPTPFTAFREISKVLSTGKGDAASKSEKSEKPPKPRISYDLRKHRADIRARAATPRTGGLARRQRRRSR